MGSVRQRFSPAFLSAGALTLDTGAHALIGPHGSCDLHLGAYAVLRALMQRPGMVVEIGQLVAECWPDVDLEPGHAEGSVRVRVLRARAAIESVGASGKLLRSVSGIGYRIEGAPRVVRAFTLEQAAALDQLLATHPNAALVAAFAVPTAGASA